MIQGLPVRKVRSHPRQRHYAGIFWSATDRAHVLYESRLELDRLCLADYASEVVRIAAQPMWLCSITYRYRRRISAAIGVTPHHSCRLDRPTDIEGAPFVVPL